MKKAVKNISYILLSSITFIVGIFIGFHHLNFQAQIIKIMGNSDEIISDVNVDYINLEDNGKIDNTSSTINDDSYILPTKSEIRIDDLWTIWDTLRSRFFVEENIDADDVLYGTIAGMVDSLGDDYTVFLNPDEADDFDIDVNGDLEGIGAELIYRKKMLIVEGVIKNSPAFKAGLKADDIILKVDDESTSELGFYPSIKKIRGKKGTEVILTVYRGDAEETIDLAITRDKIEVENVTWEKIDDKYAHLMVNRFTPDVEQELRKASIEIIAFDPKGIILDLRDNGGGYMDQAIMISDDFIDDGVIVSRKYKNGNDETFRANQNTIFKDYPLVVLINGGSASASEIVAGAIQDHKRGLLIGETSYGKGSVQETLDFNGAMLKMTVAKWYTPDDRNINGIGLTPDVEVEIPEDLEEPLTTEEVNNLYLDKAIEFLNAV